jgi:hypothetical protein
MAIVCLDPIIGGSQNQVGVAHGGLDDRPDDLAGARSSSPRRWTPPN